MIPNHHNPVRTLCLNIQGTLDLVTHMILHAQSDRDIQRASDLLYHLQGAAQELVENSTALLKDIGRFTCEPLPNGVVEDFEASVLRDIAYLP